MAGIYLHIPFCRQACHYCDFFFTTQGAEQENLVKAIEKELLLQERFVGDEAIETVYFGGGTPSLLSAGNIDSMFQVINKTFEVSAQAEITLEANPDDLTAEKLDAFRKVGINRLSIGIQSFDDDVLRYLNRVHNAAMAMRSVEWARQAGFNNISIDLIYAIPALSIQALEMTITQTLAMSPEHISAYNLTIEPRTVFGNRLAKGKLVPVDEVESAAQMQLLMDKLIDNGYQHYEISNFGKPGYYSRHNTSYWKQKKFLGVGPSAHSFNGITRQFNVSNNAAYMKAINSGLIPSEIEVLSLQDNINDYLMTSLRTEWGCDLDLLKNEFGYDLIKIHDLYLDTLAKNQLAVIEKNCLKLSQRGKFVADKISSDLFFTV